MQTDALAPVSWRARPRSFVALMALYESNFVRLGWLAGELGRLHDEQGSCVEGDCELRLIVLERARYTTTVRLSYAFGEPDLIVRIYHDARLAEVQGEGDAGSRWRSNMMLNKWLEYCADRGHRFSP